MGEMGRCPVAVPEAMQITKEKTTNLPSKFNRDYAIVFLENPRRKFLYHAFQWNETSQGEDYWFRIYKLLDNSWEDTRCKVPDEAIIQSCNLAIYFDQNHA